MATGVAMINARLAAYLSLEREMLALDATGDPLADLLRDAMDPLWYGLTDEEHARLDARVIREAGRAAMTAPIGEALFTEPTQVASLAPRSGPISATDWGCAA